MAQGEIVWPISICAQEEVKGSLADAHNQPFSILLITVQYFICHADHHQAINLHTHTPLSSFLDRSLPNYPTYIFKLWRVAIFWRAFQMRYQCLRDNHVTLAAPRFKNLGEKKRKWGGENVVLFVK